MAVEVSRVAHRDAAELVAQVASAKRNVLMHVYRRRLGWEDLEDCYSQTILELVVRAHRGGTFDGPQHVANALEQKFVSRINDRHRAMAGRSAGQAAMASALSTEDESSGVTDLADHRAAVADQVIRRYELKRLREVAEDLSPDQRLVLACQVSLGMESSEFCRRYGWSAEKFRKVAQRARAKLRVLVVDYQSGERCRQMEPTLLALASGVADAEVRRRAALHLENCTSCAHTVRELERAGREVASVLAPGLGAGAGVAKLGLVAGVLRRGVRLLPGSHGAPAAVGTGAAAGGGTAALGMSGSALGLGAVKLGVAALCVAGMAGGYAVCAHTGLLSPGGHKSPGPPGTKHVTRRSEDHQSPRFGPVLGPVLPGIRHRAATRPAVVPVTHATRPAGRRTHSAPARGWTATRQAQREFGAGASHGGRHRDLRLRPASVPSGTSATASSFESQIGTTRRRSSSSSSRGRGSAGEFGFEG